MRRAYLPLLFVALSALVGCPPTPSLPPATGGGGFVIETAWNYNGVSGLAPYTTTNWTWQSDNAGAAGDPSPFTSTTNAQSLDSRTDGRINAKWTVMWGLSLSYSACLNISGTITINSPGEIIDVTCFEASVGVEYDPFTFSPNPMNTAAPPTSVTIQGSGFDPTYGMPVVQYFDMNGNLDAQQAAASVSSDGTTLTFATPNFTELSSGTYAGVISNIASNGSYQYVGTTAVDVPAPFYRPTTYSDMGANDPNDGWTLTSSPNGPIAGATLGSYTTTLTAFDDWEVDENGNLDDVNSEGGQCTWSGFPSHVDANDLTLYIPYSISVGGSTTYNAGFYYITVSINGATSALYATSTMYGSGVLTATVPAGTDLSTIQVTVSDSPENQNPAGNPGVISDYIWLDIYIQ
jgi:hypothetical protein